jgi:anti-anti-sigma factor
MELEIRRLTSGAIEISPRGILDESTVGLLRPHLLDRGDRVLLDLSGLKRIDPAGMALLLLARIELEALGGALVVQAPQPPVSRALERAGFARFVTVAQERIDALRAVRRPGALAV